MDPTQEQIKYMEEYEREKCVERAVLILLNLFQFINGRDLPGIKRFIFVQEQAELQNGYIGFVSYINDNNLKCEFEQRKKAIESVLSLKEYDELENTVIKYNLFSSLLRIDSSYQEEAKFLELMNRAAEITSHPDLSCVFWQASSVLKIARILSGEEDLIQIIPYIFL
jgi:hypothetical protein